MASPQNQSDIVVIGAGILGVSVAYWLSSLYQCDISLVDSAPVAGVHTSSRNTGVIHRPFYLDPDKKRVFAKTAGISHHMWERLARQAGLPWMPVGTFNVAVEESELRVLEKYRSWGLRNGMDEGELELMDGPGVRAVEPEVECMGGILSKTDVSVDFGVFTRYLWRMLLQRGVKFRGGSRVVRVRSVEDGRVELGLTSGGGAASIRCGLLVNAAGGGALSIAHASGLALEYSELNFRGEYWVVEEPFASRVKSNIYRPPRYPQFPFLDPHFVVRSDGSRQIGPNAVLVPGPYVYSGVGLRKLGNLLTMPVSPKANLMRNASFLSLLAGEWRSSVSKRTMCGRVRKFIPGLRAGLLRRRAVFGVRSSVVGPSGFVPEALLIRGESSAHIINFNSPGATGAPAYSALVVDALMRSGFLDRFTRRAGGEDTVWSLDEVLSDVLALSFA